ncbi:MAG TPA: prepilin-type N-terminal cleavage/methylation domain-containing protein [Candidatus Saccharimonadales bacterium]|nr:prepilin-type N-terminal cleavage/methylation domain-containing protein [Candidatus Saccharimonadales bacterium]
MSCNTDRSRRRDARGFTMVEVLVASTVLSIVLLAAVTYQVNSMHANTKIKDRAFATQKAIQMMEELRGYVNGGAETNIDVLDGYDDGAVFNTILTTDKKVTDAADPLSGNHQVMGDWRYLRQISIRRLPEAPNARLVEVRVYYAQHGSSTVAEERLAEVSSILKTVGNISVPTEVMDIYILALENVPGWWSNMATLRPMFDNSISDLENRNPGLEIRRHWITRLGYGRDPNYTPYVNLAANAATASLPWVYYYPGMLDVTNSKKYYEPNNIRARFNLDGTVVNGTAAVDATTGYTSTVYSLADAWNHCKRYPEELSMYQAAQALDPTLEPSLRLLLEDMNTNPTKYTNALVVNLHGEMLPLPPMHNFSDPAKDPRPTTSGGQPLVRAVTHPERLYYATGDTVRLRVYTYLTRPDTSIAPTETHAFLLLKNAVGQVSVDSVRQLNATDSIWVNNPANVSTSGSDILIDLPHSKLKRERLPNNRGLATSARLDGMDYIPCPFRGAFLKDLTSTSSRPKNTAEWVIRLHYTGSGMLTVETRLGDPVLMYGSGSWSDYPNLSRTYAWIGTSHPPITEQYQFMGDPRHCPYADVQQGFGYNWYFTSVDTSQYPGISKTSSGWGSTGSSIGVDLPRYYSLWRNAMLKTGSIWTNMTGFSFYYIGLGGEMGADASNGYPNGLPIGGAPWNLSGQQQVDEITAEQTVNSCRMPARNDNSWFAIPWLGELYPDEMYAPGGSGGWSVNGNLPTGSGNFYRAQYDAAGSPLGARRQRRASVSGCASLMNGKGSGSGPYRHEYRDDDVATVMTDGLNLSGRFNLGVPSTMAASRPFTLDYGSSNPPEWSDTAYSNYRTTLSFLKSYFNAPYGSSYRSSANIKVSQGGRAAHFVVNGLSPQTSSGAAWMARFALVSMVQSFFDAGDPSVSGWIPQIPRVQVLTPDPNDDLDNPTSINVTWKTDWLRWDKQSYSLPAYTPSSVTMAFALKYSSDGGRSWKYADDNSDADAGARAVDGSGNDLHTVSQPFSWNVSELARGSYILRLEAYRSSTQLHYAYHQVQIYIKRSGV